ncbi:TPA: hypothetical protein QEK28_004526 [Stenotrophomonas maltophilia]|nr:hypothetical protein [Stenotrophomonas maltophilia]
MNYNDLEQRYDAFVLQEKYAELEQVAEKSYQDAETDQQGLVNSNYEFNGYFLRDAFGMALSKNCHTEKKYSFEISGKRVDFDITQSPDFRDKNKYLDWLHKQINN